MVYYAVIIFLSAFLVFQVQPMLAKYILPWFGGTPAVWSSVQMFFQIALTGGYAYASWLVRPGKHKQWIHISLLAISAVLLILFGWIWKSPITPDASWKPEAGAPPIWEIVKLLAVSVGLPYFLLSTNSPLVQTWFQRAFPGKTAYRLYALSNVGSMLGLISYPLLVEPFFTLKWQGWIWAAFYLLFVGLALWGVIRSRRLPAIVDMSNSRSEVGETRASPRRVDILLWLGLGATASTLLLATTSHITQEVAVIPFLWVLPLAIYLLSFIIAFSGERWYSRQFFLPAFFVSTLLAGWAMGRSEDLAIGLQIGIYSLTLFCACMICHGELFRLRPHPSFLTVFYLYVSIGGALGGIFITFLAPQLFKGYWELPLGIAFCWILFLIVSIKSKDKTSRVLFVVNQVLMFSALVFASIRAMQFIQSDLQGSEYLARNFYGVVRVKLIVGDDGSPPRLALVHGITIHGFQYLNDHARDIPTAYFGETGGGGLVLRNYPRSGYGMRVGILGLGIGTLASYGQTGDTYRFYEINPLVIQIAEGQGGYFSYLADSQADIEIVAGDARLSLEEEYTSGGSQAYDVLILDVFSSDSIPVHLLDQEAFELYLQHLSQSGILAVHISNRHLDLIPVVWTLADHFDLARVVISDPGDQEVVFPSLWMLLAEDPGLLMDPDIVSRSMDMTGYEPSLRLWTDDYSNLIQILK